MGGVEALQRLVGGLPGNLPAAVLVVLHIAPEATSVLPGILARAGPLPATHGKDGEAIHPGHIYIAPPDFHMLVEDGRIRITRGPRENRHRPAIDPLFRSAALWYGPWAIGVVLTGALDDGTAGLSSIKQRGGVAVVQDPADAVAPGMPRSARENVEVDHVAPLDEIPGILERLVALRPAESAQGNGRKSMRNGNRGKSRLEKETKIAKPDMDAIEDENRPGTPSAFSCPECHGVLWQVNGNEKGVLRFRCRVGHAYTAANLRVEQEIAVERALWAAMRALEEDASLAQRMAESAEKAKHKRLAVSYRERAEAKMEQAHTLRGLLVEGKEPVHVDKTA